MWCIHTMEYYSTTKRNEVGRDVDGLEAVIQSEINQKQKNKYGTLTHI